MENNFNPYKGIETYDLKDRAIFHGREREIADITDIILNNKSTILTGYSGCGKTSLLKAGIWPELDQYYYHLIYVTPNKLFRNKEQIREKLFPLDFWNGVVKEIHKQCDNYNLKCNKKTLLEELMSDHTDRWYGNSHSFIIVIDQFEEFFQYNLNEKYKTLFFKIYDILCGNYSNELICEVHKEINKYIEDYKNEKEKNSDDKNNEYDSLEYNILPQSISEIAKESGNNRLVLTVRKDYLYDLQIYANRFPVISSNIHFIEYLDDDQARMVIQSSKKFENLSDEAIKFILSAIINKTDFDPKDDKPDYYVDTMLLSIIMYQLWEEYKDETELNRLKENEFKIKIETIINEFYFAKINALKREFVEVVKQSCTDKKDKIGRSVNAKKQIIRSCDRFIQKLEANLISKTGLYRRSVYIDEIRNFIDEEVYGDIQFRKINTIKELDKLSKNIVKYETKETIEKYFQTLKENDNEEDYSKMYNSVNGISVNKVIYKEINFKDIKNEKSKLFECIIDEKEKERMETFLNDEFKKNKKSEDIVNNLKNSFTFFSIEDNKIEIIDKISDENVQNITRNKICRIIDKDTVHSEDDAKKCRIAIDSFLYNDDVIKDIIEKIRSNSLFLPTSKGNKEGLELRHDRLCKYVSEHIKTIDSQQENALRYSANIYLTPIGRLKYDNCFIEPVFGPWNSYSAIQRTVFFMEGGIAKILNMDTKFIQKCVEYNNDTAKSMLLTYDIKKETENDNAKLDSSELFSQINVKVVHNKIYEISFSKKDGSNVSDIILPTGYHKIVFYYDKYDRLIIKRFFKDPQKEQPAIIDGYDSICYYYEKEYHNLPDATFFTNFKDLNPKDKKSSKDPLLESGDKEEHLFLEIINPEGNFEKIAQYRRKSNTNTDDNYGFVSYYDKYGREIVRHLLYENNKPKYGFDLIRFDRKDNSNLIESISYFLGGNNVSFKVNKNIERPSSTTMDYFISNKSVVSACYCQVENSETTQTKVHQVVFAYDSKDRIENTYYYDNNEENVELNGIYGEKYNFDDESEYIVSTYMDKYINKNGKKVRDPKCDNNGIMYAKMHRSETDRKRIDYIEWQDEHKKNKNGRRIGKKEYCKIEFKKIANKCFARYFEVENNNLILIRTSENIDVKNIVFLPEKCEKLAYPIEEKNNNTICINITFFDDNDNDNNDDMSKDNVDYVIKALNERKNLINFYGLIILSKGAYFVSDSAKILNNTRDKAIAIRTEELKQSFMTELMMYYKNLIEFRNYIFGTNKNDNYINDYLPKVIDELMKSDHVVNNMDDTDKIVEIVKKVIEKKETKN